MRTKAKGLPGLCLAVLLVLMLAACGPDAAEQWQTQYDLGAKYLSEMHYEQAVAAFTEAISIDEKNPAAYLARAEAYLAQGGEAARAAALADYEQTARLLAAAEPADDAQQPAESWHTLARGYFALDDWQSAVDALQQALDQGTPPEALADTLTAYGLTVDEEGRIVPDEDANREMSNMLTKLNKWALFQYFLTQAERETLLRPLIPRLRFLLDWYGGEHGGLYAEHLSVVQYLLGDLEGAQAVRAEMYRLTGEEHWDPDGYTVTYDDRTETFNGLGQETQILRSDGSGTVYTYDEMGRCIRESRTAASGAPGGTTEYIYENGRLARVVTTDENGGESLDVYRYEPGLAIREQYVNGRLVLRETYTLNAYGGVEEKTTESL